MVEQATSLERYDTRENTASAAVPINIDLLFRVQQSAPEAPRIIVAPAIVQPIHSVLKERALFSAVVRNLWQSHKYNQEYNAFLLGSCTEKEFLAVAERYATPFQSFYEETLLFASSSLLNLLGESLTSSDLSVLLSTDPAEIERTLASSPGIQHIDAEKRKTMVKKDEAPAAIEGQKILVRGLAITPNGLPRRIPPGETVFPFDVKRRGEGTIVQEASPKACRFRVYSLLNQGDQIAGKTLWGFSSSPLKPDNIRVGQAGRSSSHSGQDITCTGTCLLEIVHGWRGVALATHPKELLV